MSTEIGRNLIKRFEGLRLAPYQCEAGRWTIGYGHASPEVEAWAKAGKTISEHQAEIILDSDLERFEGSVARSCSGANANQYGALVCLCFNIGVANFEASTLVKRYKQGDLQGCAAQFLVWNKITKDGIRVRSEGLTARRLAEQKVFLEVPS